MAEPTVQVEAARTPDRDRLLRLLRDEGLDARAVDEVAIEIPCGADSDRACGEVADHVERVVVELGAPFVPERHDGVVYIRPPAS